MELLSHHMRKYIYILRTLRGISETESKWHEKAKMRISSLKNINKLKVNKAVTFAINSLIFNL